MGIDVYVPCPISTWFMIQRDPAVPADANERVRREDRRRCLGGRGKNPRTRGAMPSHQKSTARGGTDEEQLATR
jgi:hypothetical protein